MTKRLSLACLLVFSAAAQAAIDGIVTNGTTGKPQAGSTVTLFQTTQQGPQFIVSVKSGADGKFVIDKDIQPGRGGGPLLIQAVYGGVQYNKVITPGQPTTGVEVPVYESSKQPAGAEMQQHFMVLEPDVNGTITVDEIYVYQNSGKTTWNDPARGTLQFALPAAAKGQVEVNVLAPGGLPIRRAPDPAGKPNEFKLDFPIKPGESRVEMHWTMPFTTPGVFEDRILAKGGPTRIVAPQGITFKGDGITEAGQEPTTKATIYNVSGADLKVNIEGVAVAQPAQDAGGGQAADSGQNNGQQISENLPKLFGLAMGNADLWQSMMAVKWILLSVIGMLTIGFILLYRKGSPQASDASSSSAASATVSSSESATKASSRHARGRG
jgi:hypothetical protein